jgi:hypothetical protein
MLSEKAHFAGQTPLWGKITRIPNIPHVAPGAQDTRETVAGCESPHGETVVRDARFPHYRKALEQSRPSITASRKEEKTYTRRLDNSGNIEGKCIGHRPRKCCNYSTLLPQSSRGNDLLAAVHSRFDVLGFARSVREISHKSRIRQSRARTM